MKLRGNGKGVVHQHRSIIIQQLRGWLYDALLSKTISYSEFKYLCNYVRDNLSWESITGVRQQSIFDPVPDFEFKE